MQLRGVAIDWDSSWGEQQRLVHWLSIIVHSQLVVGLSSIVSPGGGGGSEPLKPPCLCPCIAHDIQWPMKFLVSFQYAYEFHQERVIDSMAQKFQGT